MTTSSMRSMGDSRLRDLERSAALGDLGALRAWADERRRRGEELLPARLQTWGTSWAFLNGGDLEVYVDPTLWALYEAGAAAMAAVIDAEILAQMDRYEYREIWTSPGNQ